MSELAGCDKAFDEYVSRLAANGCDAYEAVAQDVWRAAWETAREARNAANTAQGDTEVNAMRLVCIAATEWKLAADAVDDFDVQMAKKDCVLLSTISTSVISQVHKEDRKRLRLVEARLKAQVLFWNAVHALGWHNQERNRPCPKS